MTKRELHLEHIRIEVAREGRITQEAIRHYVENRISRQAFQEAIDRGMRQHIAGQCGPNGGNCRKLWNDAAKDDTEANGFGEIPLSGKSVKLI